MPASSKGRPVPRALWTRGRVDRFDDEDDRCAAGGAHAPPAVASYRRVAAHDTDGSPACLAGAAVRQRVRAVPARVRGVHLADELAADRAVSLHRPGELPDRKSTRLN